MTCGNILFILSFQVILPPCSPSRSTDSEAGSPQCSLGDENENVDPSSSSATISNEHFVFSSEDDEPMDLSIPGQLPTTNGFGGLRGTVSEELDHGPLDLTNSHKDKMKARIMQNVPFLLKVESSEEEETIRYFV